MALTFPKKHGIVIIMRGDYFVVEKVKPDPLNLLVNTNVGKQSIKYLIRMLPETEVSFLL